MDYFIDELSAHRFVEGILWPDGPTCPHCGAQGRVGRLDGNSTRLGAYKCYACRRIFSITYGTVLSGAHVPLHKWLQAIYLTDGGTRPVRPSHLAKILNVSQKTATMMQRTLTGKASMSADRTTPRIDVETSTIEENIGIILDKLDQDIDEAPEE